MTVPENAQRLRIYFSEDARADGVPAYEAVVLKARELGLAGATVTRGSMGFGRGSRIHTAKVLRLSSDLPIIVEVVDAAENIDALLEEIGDLLSHGLATVEPVRVVHYGEGERRDGRR